MVVLDCSPLDHQGYWDRIPDCPVELVEVGGGEGARDGRGVDGGLVDAAEGFVCGDARRHVEGVESQVSGRDEGEEVGVDDALGPGGVDAERGLESLEVACDGGFGVRGEGGAVVLGRANYDGYVGGAGVALGNNEVGRVDVGAVLDNVAGHGGVPDKSEGRNLL